MGEFERRLRKHINMLVESWKDKIHSRDYIDAYRCIEHNLLEEDVLGLDEAKREFQKALETDIIMGTCEASSECVSKWFGSAEEANPVYEVHYMRDGKDLYSLIQAKDEKAAAKQFHEMWNITLKIVRIVIAH